LTRRPTEAERVSPFCFGARLGMSFNVGYRQTLEDVSQPPASYDLRLQCQEMSRLLRGPGSPPLGTGTVDAALRSGAKRLRFVSAAGLRVWARLEGPGADKLGGVLVAGTPLRGPWWRRGPARSWAREGVGA
jgi:hypothetical protein